jgi:Trp operon repressor
VSSTSLELGPEELARAKAVALATNRRLPDRRLSTRSRRRVSSACGIVAENLWTRPVRRQQEEARLSTLVTTFSRGANEISTDEKQFRLLLFSKESRASSSMIRGEEGLASSSSRSLLDC